MQVHYLSGNPKKKKKVAKRRNPEVLTFSNGNDTKTAKKFSIAELNEIDNAVKSLKKVKNKISTGIKTEGKSKASISALNKSKALAKKVDSFLYGLELDREYAKEGIKDATRLLASGYNKTGSKFVPMSSKTSRDVKKKGKVVSKGNIDNFVRKVENEFEKISSGAFEKELGTRMSAQKKAHRAKVSAERRAVTKKNHEELRASLEKKLEAEKLKNKELKALQSRGASEADKRDYELSKESITKIVTELKGVGMAKKAKKKVAKKAKAKGSKPKAKATEPKSTKKVAKKANKKVAKKANKKVAKKANKKVAKKADKKVAKVAKKAGKTLSKKEKSKRARKAKATRAKNLGITVKEYNKIGKATGKNPMKGYVTSANPKRKRSKSKTKRNPILKFASNPVGALSAFGGDMAKSLGLKADGLIEIGSIAGVASIQPVVMNLLRSNISVVDTFMAKVESLLPATAQSSAPNILMAVATSVASAFLSKKSPKSAKILDHVARANLMIVTIKLAETAGEMIAEKTGMAGYVTSPNPRSMGAYVLDRPMGSLPRASTDFQGADFEGVDFDSHAVGEFEDDADFGSDVISISGLGSEW